ncbi:MAG TPA: hypothetical protein VHR86_02970, partial [Armatimonadota bacterium]|nr:hypothetical protein [Armatimonadota bacterium]
LFVLFLVLVWLCPGFATRPSRTLYTGSLAIAAMPAAILLVGLFEPGSSATGILLFILLLAALMAIAAALNRRLAAVAGLWLLGGALFLYDQAHGNALLQASPLGYSPYAGARYYGLGNEGFGLLIPAVLLGFTLAFERRQARAGRQTLMIAVLSFLLAAIIGENSLGANFGGALGAAAAGITALYVALHRRLSRRALFGIALAGCVLTLLPFIPEMLAGADKQSHIGRALSMLGSGGLGGVWDIMFRKLSMNLKLLRFSPWSRLLFAAGFTLVLLMRQRWEQLRAERPLLHVALVAMLGGALGALVCNDSGVQPAAEMVSAAAAAVAYWRCEKGGTAANQEGSLP